MKILRQSFDLRDVLSATFITLVVGWLAAIGFGLWIAHLQYDEVSANLPPSQVSSVYQTRIDRELLHGPLLFLPQVGVMVAVLAWQVTRRGGDARIYATVTGTLVSFTESVIALVMQVPGIFVVLLWLLLVGAGIFAGWYSEQENTKSAGKRFKKRQE